MAEKKISIKEIKKLKYVTKGELAKISGIDIKTIKSYSDLGLLDYYVGNPEDATREQRIKTRRCKKSLNRYYIPNVAKRQIRQIAKMQKKGIKLLAVKNFLTKDVGSTNALK